MYRTSRKLPALALLISAVMLPLAAQDCSHLTNFDLRGSYAGTGSGWMDLSKLDPKLLAGFSPAVLLTTFSWDGRGGGTGKMVNNLAGLHLVAEVKLTYQVHPDCTVTGLQSANFGSGWLPPEEALWVIVSPSDRGVGSALELQGIKLGTGVGSLVAQMALRRISMNWK